VQFVEGMKNEKERKLKEEIFEKKWKDINYKTILGRVPKYALKDIVANELQFKQKPVYDSYSSYSPF